MIQTNADQVRAWEKEREMQWAARGNWLPNDLGDDLCAVLWCVAVAMGFLNLILAWGLR